MNITKFSILSFLLFAFFILDIALGSIIFPLKDILLQIFGNYQTNDVLQTIIFDFRIPKAITAILAGAALSISGLQMQSVFRNPMAGPYVLGISSGASLGVAIIVLGFSSILSFNNIAFLENFTIIIAACLGAGGILLLILLVSARIKDNITILILGILFSGIASSVVSIMQYFSSESMLKAYVIWTMGSLANVSNQQLQILSIVIIIGLTISFFSSKYLNALLLGEVYAKSIGINIQLTRIIIFISTSILAGSITAFCGPIGFIGIAVPHVTRLLFKTSNHFVLIPGSIILGGITLLISDIISQLPGLESNLPINSITALIGIPVVIWIVMRNKKIANV